jgi:Family of unknown function (DUF6152)
MRYPKVLLGAPLLFSVMQALAHHSGAMFDDRKSVTLTGTVNAFQWTNPHCWIQVLVPGPAGAVEWSVEMGSPSLLVRGGWKPRTLKVGDAITVVIHPMRDGSRGGLFVSATHADGTPIAAAPSRGGT